MVSTRDDQALPLSDPERRSHADELARFSLAAVERELRVIGFKKEVNALCLRHGEAARYTLDLQGGPTLATPLSFPVVRGKSLVPLASVLSTGELTRRPPRPPDYETENRALIELAQALADSPDTILQTLTETILSVLDAGSAGISLLTDDQQRFFWPAVAGAWQAQVGGGTPRDFGPCGDVLDSCAPQLFKRLERRYEYFLGTSPPAEEALLVPFYRNGKAVGTVWAIAHDERRKFDAEDLRRLVSLSRFASAAYHSRIQSELEQRRATLAVEEAVQYTQARERLEAELRASEEATRRSEGDLRDFVENAPIGLHGVGPDGIILWANQSELDLLGIAREEYVGHHIKAFHADEPAIADILARLTNGETLHDFPARLRCKDGSIRHVLITSNALVDNGNFVHTRWLTRDITDRVKAEEILRTSERRRRLALESAGLGTFNIDPATNALTTDERFQAIFGAPGDQITYEQAFAIVHPDDRVDQRDAVEAAIRPDDPVPYATEYRVVHPGGAVRWVFAKANANFVQEGSVRKLRSFDGTVADITDRKHAEQALRESEAFSRTIIESSPDCIKVLDLDGNLLSMQSGQALLGIEDIRPFLNRSWVEFWEGADRRAAREAVATAGAGGRGNFVGLFRTLHGQPKWWDVVISPIRDPNGKPSSLLAVSRDVTLRRRAELNLAFLASVSQDLARFTDVDEMIRTVGAKIGAYLDLSLCAFVEINEAADQVVIAHDWHREDVPGLVGVYRLSDFVGDEFIRTARAGEIIVVRDTAGDRRVDRAGAEQFAALKINSFISVPLIREGQWHFALCLYRSEAYDWREDEVELTRELTARIWTRLERLRTEEAMRQSEERYRHLFNSMDEGYCVIEMQFDEHDKPVDFRYLEVNPSFERESGFVDAKGKLVSELAPPLEALWLETYGKVALTGEPIRYSNEVKALNGAWFDLYAFRVGGEKSRQVAVLFRNITHRREAERALQDSEERYRTLFESMDQAFCIIEMIRDEHGKAVDYRFLVVNPTFGKQTGMSNALGKRMRELVPDLEEHWFEIYGNVALTGEAVRFVNEAKAMGDRWFDVYACRVGGPDSYNVAILFDDITERRRSDEALRKSEERYRNLFDSIDEGFCVAELMFDEHQAPVDFRFLEVNPSFEKQTGMHDALGKRVREFAPDLEASWFQKYGDVASTGVPIRFAEESKNLRRWFDVYAFRIGGRGSRRVAMIFNNITESKKAEQALRDSAEVLADLDRRKDEFLAMLSHELRNPLAPITNAVQLLRLQKDEDPIQEHARSIIERQVGQLNHLVDDLLEVSRITTGRVQLRQERIVLSGVVERAVETARPLIEQRRHEVTVSLPLRPVWLDADASRLEQVVVNLLTNAAKYTGEGGHIWLTVEQEGDVAVLRVRDTGSGIAPELLPHIFDLFTQAERSLDRSQGGLGIGLCLVERLVALHGGTVEVSSVVDRGSEFVVRLPCILAPPLLPPPAKKAELPGAVGGGCRVLVVDDNKDAAEMLGLLLEASGHDVRIAHDGRTALTAIVDYRPAAVLLDIGLPGLDGFEVAKLIRQQPALEKIVLIALTGYGREADRQRSRDAGFDHHLLKPAAFGKVQEILASVSERGDAARLKPTV